MMKAQTKHKNGKKLVEGEEAFSLFEASISLLAYFCGAHMGQERGDSTLLMLTCGTTFMRFSPGTVRPPHSYP